MYFSHSRLVEWQRKNVTAEFIFQDDIWTKIMSEILISKIRFNLVKNTSLNVLFLSRIINLVELEICDLFYLHKQLFVFNYKNHALLKKIVYSF